MRARNSGRGSRSLSVCVLFSAPENPLPESFLGLLFRVGRVRLAGDGCTVRRVLSRRRFRRDTVVFPYPEHLLKEIPGITLRMFACAGRHGAGEEISLVVVRAG